MTKKNKQQRADKALRDEAVRLLVEGTSYDSVSRATGLSSKTAYRLSKAHNLRLKKDEPTDKDSREAIAKEHE